MPPAKKKRASKKSAKAAAPEPFDLKELRRYIIPAAIVVGLVVVGLWVRHMENVAVHQRVVQQVADHPVLGTWFRQQKTLVENSAKNPAGSAAPVALWYGEIGRTIESQPLTAGSAPRLKGVELTGTQLLAGKPARWNSGDLVTIGVYGHAFNGPSPVAGETWIFSVSRNRDGNSFVSSAACVGGAR